MTCDESCMPARLTGNLERSPHGSTGRLELFLDDQTSYPSQRPLGPLTHDFA
jgi:hypothetical protein